MLPLANRALTWTAAATVIAAVAVAGLLGPAAAQTPLPPAPVVTAIAPDEVESLTPDDSTDLVEDVQINGINFGRITSAFLTTSPTGTGTRVTINSPITVTENTLVGTIRIADLTANTTYYVFVLREDGATSTPYPNSFGYSVTFRATAAQNPPPPPPTGPLLTSCRARTQASGKLVLQVNGQNFRVADTIVLLDGQPCQTTKYPVKFIIGSSTSRLSCSGNLKTLLPATITTRNANGTLSQNSLQCGLP